MEGLGVTSGGYFSQIQDDHQEVYPGMYVSSFYLAGNKLELEKIGVTHVLQMGDFMEPKFPDEYTYKVCALNDDPSHDVKQFFIDGVKFIDKCIEGGGVILVHCAAGISRSGSMACAYLMWKNKIPFEEALKMAQEKRSKIYPNMGFRRQLLEYEKEILEN